MSINPLSWRGSSAACATALSRMPNIAERPAAAAEGVLAAPKPLDLAHMIQVWGSEATVKTLLGSFVSAVREDLDASPPLLEDVDIARLRDWHHRLAGAVGVLQYPALLAILETYRRHMNSHNVEQLRDEGFDLIRVCHAMLTGGVIGVIGIERAYL